MVEHQSGIVPGLVGTTGGDDAGKGEFASKSRHI